MTYLKHYLRNQERRRSDHMSDDLLLESFDKLYDNGYRFIESLDDFKVVEAQGHSELSTPVTHINFSYKGKSISPEQKNRIFNYAAFILSVTNIQAIK
jgi:DNA-directed RNA polymerase beta' subunit